MDTLNFKELRSLTEDEAREMLEAIRWPEGAICPHCQSNGTYKLNGKATRPGVHKCKACRKQFTVTVGTVFEGSRIKIADWLMAVYLMCSSKKGISAHQLHRTLGITYKTAWFMAHRVRYAMTQEPLAGMLSGTVEADETYIGGLEKNKHANKRTKNNQGRSLKTKTPVFAMAQRGGKIRARKVSDTKGKTLKGIIRETVSKDAVIMTDNYNGYNGLRKNFAGHETVDHTMGEYVRGAAHTNTLENWFSLLKRGVTGTYHHVSEEHLDRYLDESVFRFNRRDVNDGRRAVMALEKIGGKRLYYKEPVKKIK